LWAEDSATTQSKVSSAMTTGSVLWFFTTFAT